MRGGYGIFYDWYESNYYEQVLRVNGVTQQEDGDPLPWLPGSRPAARSPIRCRRAASSRPRACDAVRAPGVDWHRADVHRDAAVQATYMMQRGRDQFRSVNINAPHRRRVSGLDALGNVTELQSTGSVGRSIA